MNFRIFSCKQYFQTMKSMFINIQCELGIGGVLTLLRHVCSYVIEEIRSSLTWWGVDATQSSRNTRFWCILLEDHLRFGQQSPLHQSFLSMTRNTQLKLINTKVSFDWYMPLWSVNAILKTHLFIFGFEISLTFHLLWQVLHKSIKILIFLNTWKTLIFLFENSELHIYIYYIFLLHLFKSTTRTKFYIKLLSFLFSSPLSFTEANAYELKITHELT